MYKHKGKENENPQFSVLMASYNNGQFIGSAIESVINQTFKEWELVIVDDCSTDKSVEIIKTYLSDSRVRFFKNSRNIGYIGTLKRLINESRAEILGILDGDDALDEDALEKMYEAHVKNPDCGFIYSNFVFCDRDLNPVEKGFCTALPQIPDRRTILRYDIVGPFRTFRKDAYFRTPGYDDKILYAEDKDLTLKMEEVTGFFYVDKVLYLYRVLSDSQSHDPAKKSTMKSSYYLAKYKAYRRRLGTEIPNLTNKEMSDVLFHGIPHCIKDRNWRRARFFLCEAIRLFPLNVKGCLKLLFRGTKFLPRIFFRKIPKC
ncbi:MAG: glycosyltransferase family 2 protein [Nitrospirota bacterium]|nr:glycosyltransferase family 2 protein [Nitrospirota bacterium]